MDTHAQDGKVTSLESSNKTTPAAKRRETTPRPAVHKASTKAAVTTLPTKVDVKWPNLYGMVRLTLGWFLMFSAFLTTQNVLPMFLQQAGFGKLGFYSLMVLYFFFASACVPAPMLLKSVAPRKALPVAAFSYILYIATAALVVSGLVPKNLAQAIFIFNSALIGICASVMWISQGYILKHYASEQSLKVYLSIFFAAFSVSAAIGAQLAKTLMAHLSIAGIFAVLSGVAVAGNVCLLGLPKPDPALNTPIEPELDSRPLSQKLDGLGANLAKPFQLVISDPAAARIFFQSLLLGVGFNCFAPALLARSAASIHSGETEGRANIAKAMVFLGIGNTAAAICYAPLASRVGSRFCHTMQPLMLLAVGYGLCSETQASGTPHAGYWVFFAAFAIGLANVTTRLSLNAVVSSIFKEEMVQYLALVNLSMSAGTVVGFAVLPEIPLQPAIAGVLVAYAAVTLLFVSHSPFFKILDSKSA